MHPQEINVSPLSDYYVYAPSALAQKLYLYPLSVGHFLYKPGYWIQRNSFDSFLILSLTKGNMHIVIDGKPLQAQKGDCVLLNCYLPHAYGSPTAWEASWIHFDGVLAQTYYNEITSHAGNILSPRDAGRLQCAMDTLLGLFRSASPIIEARLSNLITDIMDDFLYGATKEIPVSPHTSVAADSIAYINEHFHEPLSLEDLASNVNLSLYHFTKIFAKETGCTPHQYLISTRITAAKYLLKTSPASIKDIGFRTGFQSESSFCTTFKKWAGITPTQYRNDTISR